MPGSNVQETKRRRSKLRQERSEQKHREILNAARVYVSREGNAEFSSQNIASEAGMSLSTLQYYFPTKADLYRSLLDRSLDNYRLLIESVIKSDIDADKKLQEVFRILLLPARERAELLVLRAFVNLAATNVDAANVVQVAFDESISQIDKLIRMIVPGIDPEIAHGRAMTIIALVEGFESMVFRENYSMDKILEFEEVIVGQVLTLAAADW